MPHPEQPVFRPGRVDDETVRTHYLECSGVFSKIDLVAEVDFQDGYPVAGYYDPERRIIPLLSRDGQLSVYSRNDPERPPRELLQGDTGLGDLRYAAIGEIYKLETAAAVVAESSPDEVALLSLSEGGQFATPQVMNVYGRPFNVEIAEPEVTALDFGKTDEATNVAIAYGRDVIVHHPGARPGRGIMTDRERQANRELLEEQAWQIHGKPLEEVEAEIEAELGKDPDDDPNWLNVYEQKLRAAYHVRLPEPVIALSLGSYYGRYSHDVLYALGESGRGWTIGIDSDVSTRRDWPKPHKPSVFAEFDVDGGDRLCFLEESSVGGLLVGNGDRLEQRFAGHEHEPLGTIRPADGRSIVHASRARHHSVFCLRELDGPGGSISVIDRHPEWSRR